MIPERRIGRRVKWLSRLAYVALLSLSGVACGPSPWAGHWEGLLKLDAGKSIKLQSKYSETKPSLKSTMDLSADGSYVAKFQDVDYEGTWSAQVSTITLKPTKFMGIEMSQMPSGASGGNPTAGNIFKPYVAEGAEDGKKLIHREEFGTVTFTKKD